MNSKSRNTLQGTISAALLVLLAGIVVTLATGPTLSQSQQAPTLRIVSEDGNRLPIIVITGEDIRNLPPGETRIIQKFEGGDTGGAQTQAGGGVWKTTNGGKTWSLNKDGAGHLILPSANTYRGVTTVASAALSTSPTNNPNLTKELTGTLVLPSAGALYEFRDLSAAEFDKVYVEESLSLNFEEIKLFVQERRPPGEMNGWPFKRLLIARAGSKNGDTSTGKTKTYTNPQGKISYVCNSGFCGCSGSKDCQSLADSTACASAITCDASGPDVKCFCRAK